MKKFNTILSLYVKKSSFYLTLMLDIINIWPQKTHPYKRFIVFVCVCPVLCYRSSQSLFKCLYVTHG